MSTVKRLCWGQIQGKIYISSYYIKEDNMAYSLNGIINTYWFNVNGMVSCKEHNAINKQQQYY